MSAADITNWYVMLIMVGCWEVLVVTSELSASLLYQYLHLSSFLTSIGSLSINIAVS